MALTLENELVIAAPVEEVAAPPTPLVGTSVLRKEDLPLLTGAARFVGDVELPGMLHATVVRSPVAHARLVSVGTEEALAQPGVVAVLTGHELPPATPPIPIRMFSQPGMERFLQHPLARGTVRYSGDP